MLNENQYYRRSRSLGKIFQGALHNPSTQVSSEEKKMSSFTIARPRVQNGLYEKKGCKKLRKNEVFPASVGHTC